MKVTVTFEDKLYDTFSDKKVADLNALEQDLTNYFSSSKSSRPDYIGKDVPFERPDNITDVELHHIHFYVDNVSCKSTWSQKSTSDSYIVYTYGFMNEEAYHVVDIIGDNAHQACKDYCLMRTYKVIAENFRNKN